MTNRSHFSWHSRFAPLLLIAAGFAVTVVLFTLVRDREDQHVRIAFTRETDTIVHALGKSLEVYQEVLHSIESYFQSSADVTRADFSRFVQRSLSNHQGIQALEWVPRVPHPSREAYVLRMRQEHPRFEITERLNPGEDPMVPADERDEYFPVQLVEPFEGNERALGFDLASDSVRRDAMRRALVSGEAAATAPIKLVQEASHQLGVLVVVPVFEPPPPRDAGHGRLRGYVVGVIRIGDMVEASLVDLGRSAFAMSLFDVTDPDPVVLYDCGIAGSGKAPSVPADVARVDGSHPMTVRRALWIGGREWSLRFEPTEAFLAANPTVFAWVALVSGSIITSLVGAFLVLVAGRAARIEQVVSLRTVELQETTDELRLSRDAAESANRAKTSFLARMSHELRTPLNAILGYSYLVQQEARDTGQDALLPDLERIHASGRHLLEVIDSILDLSKIEAGRIELSLGAFEVPDLIDAVATTVRPIVAHNDNVLEVRCPTGSWTITADAVKTRQILLNLTSNAAKFTRNGRITLSATAVTSNGEPWVRFDVADTGIGIAAEQLDHVFEEFAQSDDGTTRRFGGTGLGLAISRRFCELMGGRITVDSEVGRGSTFTVWLPAVVSG